MSTEIAVSEEQFAPAIGSGPAGALGVLSVYADAIDMAYNFADKLCRTPLVGTVYRGKPADAAVAILYGAELGLNPIQSLQNIFTVHGTPAIYTRTMVALLKVKGYRIDPIESSDESVTVVGYSPTGQEVECTWTIERARKAGYVPEIDPNTGDYRKNANGKLDGNMKYLTDPQTMLYAKAAAEVCRKLAPDVLLGIAHSAEDIESEPAPVRVVSERVTPVDVAATGAAGGGLSTTQWTAPPAAEPEDAETDAASNEGEKPDNPQVEEPAKASPDQVPEMATAAEQRALSDQLERHGHKTPAAKRAYLTKETGRKIGSARELHGFEARAIAERLTVIADPEQVAALRRALEADNVHAEGEQLDWIRANGAPDLGDWGDLDADRAVDLTSYLLAEQAKDAAKAGGQAALDTDGAGQ
ncbi:hypothetical protein [Nocardia asiatica]